MSILSVAVLSAPPRLPRPSPNTQKLRGVCVVCGRWCLWRRCARVPRVLRPASIPKPPSLWCLWLWDAWGCVIRVFRVFRGQILDPDLWCLCCLWPWVCGGVVRVFRVFRGQILDPESVMSVALGSVAVLSASSASSVARLPLTLSLWFLCCLWPGVCGRVVRVFRVFRGPPPIPRNSVLSVVSVAERCLWLCRRRPVLPRPRP